jgi:hypothetical protein
MQAGTDPWEAAGFLGMTVETLMSRYGHHHPDYQILPLRPMESIIKELNRLSRGQIWGTKPMSPPPVDRIHNDLVVRPSGSDHFPLLAGGKDFPRGTPLI